MKQPALDELLTYENPGVVSYFTHHNPTFSLNASRQLFTDLLGWLWLNALRQQKNCPTYFFGPLLPMDDMWHAFILHSRDYVSFCERYFDGYFHHNIEPIGMEHQLAPEEIGDFLYDCFEYLGEQWVIRYFGEALPVILEP
ncbi:glycine-rich domain-containing protein [Legionella spiritensis]|uniref:Uncharacterized protein n=1 Tax=Legionella spiritensis TaxID=452 RepID=A0A0W0ZAD3_LEGSP|nr:hypothetical protein [Legionella spiritensis]KTD66085.1 hypothetical protein Lspi_0148 [Legionella spiritensis]SNV44285.1 Uncharacterized conserved protein [Legionella spiritensis]VEG90779.1 Uncharacterized conserved protein [Legionella spiritensis]